MEKRSFNSELKASAQVDINKLALVVFKQVKLIPYVCLIQNNRRLEYKNVECQLCDLIFPKMSFGRLILWVFFEHNDQPFILSIKRRRSI